MCHVQTIAGLEKDILGHKKELLERDETIRDKEKRIYDLKKKNQELEKFKFVLDYKIRELKRQAEPKDEQIADMRDTVKVEQHSNQLLHASHAAPDFHMRLMCSETVCEATQQRDMLMKPRSGLHAFSSHAGQSCRIGERCMHSCHYQAANPSLSELWT